MASRKKEYWHTVTRTKGGYYKKGEERVENIRLGLIEVLIILVIVLGVEVTLAAIRAAL